MAIIRKYFVFETTTTQGTGNYSLAGPVVTGFESFSDQYANGEQFNYAVEQYDDTTGNLINYEVGTGQYVSAGDQVQRVSVTQSSNADAAVNWGVGTKNIYVTQAASDPMIGSNNLSEVTNAATSRSNISAVGLGDNSTFSGNNVFNGTSDFNGKVDYRDAVSDVQTLTSGTSVTWNVTNGNMANIVLGHNVTTFTISNVDNGGSYALRVVQGAGPYSITWPAAVKWAGGQEPTLSQGNGDIDSFMFMSWDGTELLGFSALDFA